MQKKQVIVPFLVIVVVLLVLGGGLIYQLQNHSAATSKGGYGEAAIGGEFSLVDTGGRTVTDKDLRGKFLLVFFGFTRCPDMCPLALGVITEAMKQLGKEAEQVQPVFITVDPERDTREKMAEYLTHFYPGIIGLTGSKDAITKAEQAYRVYSSKISEKKEKDYRMDHSGLIYFMGKDGKFVGFFPHSSKPEEIVEAVRKAL